MERFAVFSDCGKYRYVLGRIWDDSKPIAMCIGLNPSTGNNKKDDNTIMQLIGYMTELGFGGFNMTNLYSFISSHPEDLSSCPDPVKDNDMWLLTTAHICQEIIFCWGAFKQAEWRAKKVRAMFPDGKCFGRTKNGSPWHPRAMGYINNHKPSLSKYGETK